MNYNISNGAENGKLFNGTNEQRLFALFSDVSFNKEDAAKVLGITVSGAYKLLQRMKEQGLLTSQKQGKQWVYSFTQKN